MKQITTILLAGTIAMFMSACGGGSSDPVDPIEPSTTYDLRTWIDTGGYLINGEGTLTSSEGTINVTGSFQSEYLGTSTAPTGETLHDHNITMILSAEGLTQPFERKISRSTYMGNVISVTNAIGGGPCETTLELAALTPVPTNAEIGYISETIPYLCDDGRYITNQIKLEDAGSGNALFSLLINVYESEGGALIINETDSIVITPDMNLVSGEIIGSFPLTGISYELYSTSIVQE